MRIAWIVVFLTWLSVSPTFADPVVRSIGVGISSCALLDGGEVRCWGPGVPTPTSIGLTDVTSLAVGPGHACVVRKDGTVWCWGANHDGELGDGTTVDRAVPVQALAIQHAVEVVVGGQHSCARDREGAVWCWGHPGSVGHAASIPSIKPAKVAGRSPAVIALIAGDALTCARFATAPPRCWGFDPVRILGDHPVPALAPIAAKVFERADLISIGERFACFTQQGRMWCGGADDAGQLGDQAVPDDAQCRRAPGRTIRCEWRDPAPPAVTWPPGPHPDPEDHPELQRPAPPRATHDREFADSAWFVDTAITATAIATGRGRTCAITQARAHSVVTCWGAGSSSTRDWAWRTAREIAGTEDAVAIAVTSDHGCAVLADHSLRCWGDNSAGALGLGPRGPTSSVAALPVQW